MRYEEPLTQRLKDADDYRQERSMEEFPRAELRIERERDGALAQLRRMRELVAAQVECATKPCRECEHSEGCQCHLHERMVEMLERTA